VAFGVVQYFQWLRPVDNLIHDNIMVSSRTRSDSIIIVGIDERSINELGMLPWPRDIMAETITQLTNMGAAVIGVNVLYDAVGTIPEYDQALIDAAAETDRLVLGGSGVVSRFQEGTDLLEIDDFIVPFGELGFITTVGFLNPLPDADGVLRRSLTAFRYGDITVHSFPFEVYRTYRRAMGQEPVALGDIPLDESGAFPIRYVGRPGSFRAVSLWGVINQEYPAAMFRDAIVLVGPFAAGVGDGNYPTPLERRIATHGIEQHANIVQNFLEGIFVADAHWVLNLALFIFIGVIVILIFIMAKPLIALIATVVLLAALLFGVRLTYDHLHIIVNIGAILFFLVTCYLASLIISIFAAQSDRQEIKNLFGRFVAPEVVNQIIAGGVDIQLGGVVKEITALFVDIRGFTAFSEANQPETVVDMVNRYLELTSTSIQKNSGTIDKFIGDATMALFNAPNDVPNHALCAVKAAWAMKLGAAPLRDEILKEFGVDLQFGIGVNTGSAVVGNMGSDFRMDYTAIGDAINTAARLESSAGKGQIVISDATYQQVKDYVEVEELGEMHFKNKSVGILVYSVINVRG